jgi:hypothetical protein
LTLWSAMWIAWYAKPSCLELCNSFAACWGQAARAAVQPTLHIDAIVGWHHTFTPLRGGITHLRHCGVASHIHAIAGWHHYTEGGGETYSGRHHSNALDLEGGQGHACLAVPCLVLLHITTSFPAGRLSFPCLTSFRSTLVFRPYVLSVASVICAGVACHAVCNCCHIVWTTVELLVGVFEQCWYFQQRIQLHLIFIIGVLVSWNS